MKQLENLLTFLTQMVCQTVHIQFKGVQSVYFSSVQFGCSVMSDSLQPHGLQQSRLPCPSPTPRACSCPSMPSNHLILCRPLLLLPSIFPSIRVFSNESVIHIRWPKYWSFSFSIIPSNDMQY